jgi:hypothetical protein
LKIKLINYNLASRKFEMSAKKQEKDIELYNQVVALSDLDICKFLAEIENLQTYEQMGAVRVVVVDGDDYYFDPLNNGAQCIKLIAKHDVQRTYERYDFIGWGYHVLDGENPIHILERQDFEGNGEPDLTMHKGSCLAILLNKSERFKLIN